jgi:PAS domain S-box-containing protein
MSVTNNSEDIFKAVYAHSSEAVLAMDNAGRLLSLNPTAERLFGYASDELVGRKLQVVRADSRIGHAGDTPSPGEGDTCIVHYRSRTERVFDGETRAIQLRDAAGEASGVVWIVRDVSERQSLQARLEVSDLQLRAALLSANEGSYSLNLDTGIGSIQGFLTEFLGVASNKASMSQDRWLEVVHEDDRARFKSAFDGVARNPNSLLDLVYRARRSDAVWRWLHFRGRVTEFGRDGNALRVSGIVSDVTEREALERRLVESERRLTSAMEAGSCGVWEIAEDPDSIYLHGEIRDMLGIPDEPEAIPRKLWHDQIDPEGFKKILATHAKVGRGELEGFDVTYRMRDARTGQWLWIRSQGKLLAKPGGIKRVTGILTDVTTQRNLAKKLAEKEQLLREALESTHDGAWSLDIQSGQMRIAGFLTQIFDVDEENMLVDLSTWMAAMAPEHRAAAARQYEALGAVRVDQPETWIDEVYESKLIGSGQRVYWLRYQGRIVEWDDDGVPVRTAGTVSDITEEHRQRERADDTERRLLDVVENANITLWQLNHIAEEVTLQGPAVARIFGQDNKISISTEEWMQRVHPDHVAAVVDAHVPSKTRDDEMAEIVYPVRDANDKWTWLRGTGRMLEKDSDGKTITSGGMLFDVTETRLLTSALDDEKHRFEQIYRATPAMLHSIDEAGRINEVSNFWLSHLGYEREEVIGRRSVEFLDEESRERAESSSLPELWETGLNTNIPYRFIRKDGEYVDVLLSSFLERDEKGAPLFSFAVMTDITPLRSAYEQLERTNRELDRFAAVASHDLQEPLRKIAAFSSLIQKRYADVLDDDGVRSLSYLVDAAERMQRLITDLLEYSKLASQPLQVETVDMKGLIVDVLEQLDSGIRESHAEIKIEALPEIRADRTLLSQVFQNLVGNAVKYRADAPPKIVVGADEGDDAWTVWVKDNGIGLDPKFADKVFAPFQRLHTRGEYPGTGIGLAIVQQAVERHGGRVWVESDPGQGSTFYFNLPYSPKATTSP